MVLTLIKVWLMTIDVPEILPSVAAYARSAKILIYSILSFDKYNLKLKYKMLFCLLIFLYSTSSYVNKKFQLSLYTNRLNVIKEVGRFRIPPA